MPLRRLRRACATASGPDALTARASETVSRRLPRKCALRTRCETLMKPLRARVSPRGCWCEVFISRCKSPTSCSTEAGSCDQTPSSDFSRDSLTSELHNELHIIVCLEVSQQIAVVMESFRWPATQNNRHLPQKTYFSQSQIAEIGLMFPWYCSQFCFYLTEIPKENSFAIM